MKNDKVIMDDKNMGRCICLVSRYPLELQKNPTVRIAEFELGIPQMRVNDIISAEIYIKKKVT
jgi:hypothetical protein